MNAARALSPATASPGASSRAMRGARSGLRARSRASVTPSSIRRASRPVARKLQSISGAGGAAGQLQRPGGLGQDHRGGQRDHSAGGTDPATDWKARARTLYDLVFTGLKADPPADQTTSP
jgi:hypothetical protein